METEGCETLEIYNVKTEDFQIIYFRRPKIRQLSQKIEDMNRNWEDLSLRHTSPLIGCSLVIQKLCKLIGLY